MEGTDLDLAETLLDVANKWVFSWKENAKFDISSVEIRNDNVDNVELKNSDISYLLGIAVGLMRKYTCVPTYHLDIRAGWPGHRCVPTSSKKTSFLF